MPVRKRLIKSAIALAALVTILVPAAYAGAGAGTMATTKVTIKEQNGDFWGRVISPQAKCYEERKVVLMKVKSGKDEKMAMDTADMDGDWNTGNTGYNKGRYYAKAGKISGCDADKSPIIKL